MIPHSCSQQPQWSYQLDRARLLFLAQRNYINAGNWGGYRQVTLTCAEVLMSREGILICCDLDGADCMNHGLPPDSWCLQEHRTQSEQVTYANIRHEVLTAHNIMTIIFSDGTPHSVVDKYLTSTLKMGAAGFPRMLFPFSQTMCHHIPWKCDLYMCKDFKFYKL
jgi:hypothetical protein